MKQQGLLPFFLLQICHGGMFIQVLLAGDRFEISPQLGGSKYFILILKFISCSLPLHPYSPKL